MSRLSRTLLFMSILITIDSGGIPDHAFFDTSKLWLEQAKVVIRARPKHSEVNSLYYANQSSVPHSYKRILNQPSLCSQHERVLLLYAIRTYYKHFDRRQVLRDIFNQPYFSNHSLVIKYVFLFGRTANKTIEESIRRESDQYKDIIQEDFVESYINVSLKAIMAWKWSVEFCPNVEYVLVMNDELFVDQNKLVTFLLKNITSEYNDVSISLCYLKTKHKATNFARDRHIDPKFMYQGQIYPKHCHGVGYVAHIEVINKLYRAALSNPPMMPTDVWIGILAEKLNLRMPNHRHLYVIRHIRRSFKSANYLSRSAMVAIIDEDVSKQRVAEVQRWLFNVVQRHWQKLNNTKTAQLPFTTTVSPPPFSKKTLPYYNNNTTQLPFTTTVSPRSPPPSSEKTLPYYLTTYYLDRPFSESVDLRYIMIIILLALVFLALRKCNCNRLRVKTTEYVQTKKKHIT